MCRDRKKNKVCISGAVNPQVIQTVKTYCFGNNMELTVIPDKNGITDTEALRREISETACFLMQYPNFYGNIEDARLLGEITHEAGAKFIMSCNPIALAILETPGECGADVAVGEGQPLGLGLSFGGPYLGFMAAKGQMVRNCG